MKYWLHPALVPFRILVIDTFSSILILELNSEKISYNYSRHKIKSGKRIANFPANSKNEEKVAIFYVDKKIISMGSL